MKDSVLLKAAFEEAARQMKDFAGSGVGIKDKDQLRACMSTIGAYTRLKAVENNESMIALSVSRSLADNKEELKNMIKKGLPEFTTNLIGE